MSNEPHKNLHYKRFGNPFKILMQQQILIKSTPRHFLWKCIRQSNRRMTYPVQKTEPLVIFKQGDIPYMSTKLLLCSLLHQNVFGNNKRIKSNPCYCEWKGQTIGGISHLLYLCAFKIRYLKLSFVRMSVEERIPFDSCFPPYPQTHSFLPKIFSLPDHLTWLIRFAKFEIFSKVNRAWWKFRRLTLTNGLIFPYFAKLWRLLSFVF